jgi:hypothetical protein
MNLAALNEGRAPPYLLKGVEEILKIPCTRAQTLTGPRKRTYLRNRRIDSLCATVQTANAAAQTRTMSAAT